MINGKTYGILQVKDVGQKNEIGEVQHNWVDVYAFKGFLDFQSGTSSREKYFTKIQESTHIFICNYAELKKLAGGWLWDSLSLQNGIIHNTTLGDGVTVDPNSEMVRMVVEGQYYDVLAIDDPMNLHRHLEIYLKLVGLNAN